MTSLGKATLKVGLTVGFTLGAIVGLVGCADETGDGVQGQHEFGVLSTNGIGSGNGIYNTNGINAVNGIGSGNGITAANGVMSGNGISSANGIGSGNGISSTNGYITTDAGRKVIAYLVRCALASNDSITVAGYQFNGGLGLCTQWKWNAVNNDRQCQNRVSACMLAHINTSGVHVPLWIDSEAPSIGWGTDPGFPKQEGTFFGNIISTGNLGNLAMPNVNAPAAYFCEGAGINAGVVSGRLTVGAMYNAPYSNPYGTNVKCVDRMNGGSGGQTTASDQKDSSGVPNGFKVACTNNYCWQNGETLTVWRNPTYTPTFDTVYKYSLVPTSSTTRMMGISSDGVTIDQEDIPSGGAAGDQKFQILKVGSTSNWKVVLTADNSKCIGLDPNGPNAVAGQPNNGTGNGTQMKVQSCDDNNSGQAFNVTADANNGSFQMKNVATNRCLDVAWGNDPTKNANGNVFQIYDCWNGPNQRFNMKPSY